MNLLHSYQPIVTLPSASLDIIGDVHGEYEALSLLLHYLGYDSLGRHAAGRKLVFIGDLCDRGPDSPAVVRLVQGMANAGNAICVLGNHELNILRGLRKDGNSWFWNETADGDVKFGKMRVLPMAERQSVLDFFTNLPIVACNSQLRVVHAAWHTPSFNEIGSQALTSIVEYFDARERQTNDVIHSDSRFQYYVAEQKQWRVHISDEAQAVPFLGATAYMRELRQMANPIRVLTSGVETADSGTLFSGGEWRFVQRARWWDSYTEAVPVLIGHYWRNPQDKPVSALSRGRDLFAGVAPYDWHGACGNVFCVDYCVGARFLERSGVMAQGQTRLAAMRWPERTLMFDSGEQVATGNFGRLAG